MLAVKLLSSSCSQMKHAVCWFLKTKMPGEKFMASKQNLEVEGFSSLHGTQS